MTATEKRCWALVRKWAPGLNTQSASNQIFRHVMNPLPRSQSA